MEFPTQTNYDTDQPWITYTYGFSFDRITMWRDLLRLHRWSRINGRARILCQCLVCGRKRMVSIKMPRFSDPTTEGKHPARAAFNYEHLHPDKGHPMSWAIPLGNMAVYEDGLPIDMLAMRLKAEMEDYAD